MRRILQAGALALAITVAPTALSAQIGVAVKAGSTGVGGDVALGLGESLVLRGGFGYVPFDLSDISIGDINADFSLPTFLTAGVDFYPGGGGFRLMGGVLVRSGDYEMSGDVSGSTTIGDQTYTSSGTVTGLITNSKTAPYVGIGFGKHTNSGIGLFIDLGVAFAGDPTVDLSASGPISNEPGFQSELQKEEAKIQADLRGEGDGNYVDLPFSLKTWPFAQIGLRIGLGG